MLNPESPVPLYLQLARLLKEKIEAGALATGEALPAEPKLAEFYRIGRPTVREALRILVQEGFLEKRRGAGTFVRERPAEIGLFSLAGTSSAFLEKGVRIRQRLLKKTALIAVADDPENPFNGGQAWFFSRLSGVQNDPVLLEKTWLDAGLFPKIGSFDFTRQSLSRIVREEYYLSPSGCRQTFRVLPADAAGPGIFAKGAAPLLLVSRTLFFRDGRCGLFSRLYCRTDRFVFSQEL